jgi:hypothetical protein
VLELFICKTEIKIVLRGGCSCQRLAIGFLLSSILNKLREIGTFVLFYKAWYSSPLFFSQTMANRILRVPTNFHIPWRSAFFSFFFFFFFFLKGYNMEDSKSDQYVLMSWKQCHKLRSILKGFLKGSTLKFTWNGLKIPCKGIYSGPFEITWFLIVGCTRSIPSQYR